MDALAVDAAGELVMRDLALDAQQRLRSTHGAHATVHVFKNNVDSAGHSFGCHENYLVRRFVPLEVIEHELLPFLITRQLFTGAGRVTKSGFRSAPIFWMRPFHRRPQDRVQWSTPGTSRTPILTLSADCT